MTNDGANQPRSNQKLLPWSRRRETGCGIAKRRQRSHEHKGRSQRPKPGGQRTGATRGTSTRCAAPTRIPAPKAGDESYLHVNRAGLSGAGRVPGHRIRACLAVGSRTRHASPSRGRGGRASAQSQPGIHVQVNQVDTQRGARAARLRWAAPRPGPSARHRCTGHRVRESREAQCGVSAVQSLRCLTITLRDKSALSDKC